MKGFIIVVAVAIIGVQALTKEQTDKFMKFNKECLAVSGVDPKLVQNAQEGKIVDNPKLKKHMFCFSKKAGFQNEAGKLQMNVITTQLNAELKDMNKTKKLIAKCGVQKKTPEQTVFDAVTCYYKNTPK